MIFTWKQAKRQIESGKLQEIDRWVLDIALMQKFNAQQRKMIFKMALPGGLVLPALFMVVALGNLIFDADLELIVGLIKFAVVSFILIYPLSCFGQWRKQRVMMNASEVIFGDKWVFFGKLFLQWGGLVSLKGAEIDQQNDPKLLVLHTRGTGRGQVMQTWNIPIPHNKTQQAQVLLEGYSSSL